MKISELILPVGFCISLFTLAPAMNAATESKEDRSSSKPQQATSTSSGQATFGGGCFWCFEAIFKTEDGVKTVASGYAGGKPPNPTYKQVCTGTTGHAEDYHKDYFQRNQDAPYCRMVIRPKLEKLKKH